MKGDGKTMRNIHSLRSNGATSALAAGLWLGMLSPAWAVTPWVNGDVFTGVSNGSYKVYTNAGVFKETITDGMGGFTTGCSFNPALDRLYTTNFGNTKVVVYADPSP